MLKRVLMSSRPLPRYPTAILSTTFLAVVMIIEVRRSIYVLYVVSKWSDLICSKKIKKIPQYLLACWERTPTRRNEASLESRGECKQIRKEKEKEREQERKRP